MHAPEQSGEPITAAGIEDLKAEPEQLEGPARHRDGGTDQGRPRGGRPQGERRVPRRQRGPGAPGDADQAAAGAAPQRRGRRGRRGAADSFAFGLSAEVLDETSGKANVWTLVGSTEANLAEGRLSAESPIGRALMDAKVGATVKVGTPRGKRAFKVLKLVS